MTVPSVGNVHADDLTRVVYSTDNSLYQRRPAAVLVPETVDEVAGFLQANSSTLDPLPVVGRGGGTGTNGQSLTDGVVIDVKRRLNAVVDYEPGQDRITVQSGMVADELNAIVAPDGRFWAPHTSTTSRATVGGMIATDAAGKGSLVHGRTNRHVEAVDLLLADGSLFSARPVSRSEASELASRDGLAAQTWSRLLALDTAIRDGDFNRRGFGLPELARGFSGYGLDRFSRVDEIDPLALIVGSEGTLGIICSATLRLSPIPRTTELLVACYENFDAALADAVRLRDTGPNAIECFDETTLDAARSSPSWPALGAVVGDGPGAVLMLEYTADSAIDSAGAIEAVRRQGRATGVGRLTDSAEQAACWRVRADAVGLLAKVVDDRGGRSARPAAFVEDCAVPVAAMGAFIRDFRSILDRHQLRYGMFGHADVGCVHVRPALDTTDPTHVDLVATVTAEVTAAVASYGGILWGEHGRGLRGESVDQLLPDPVLALMRQAKSAFDPDDLFNPGKLYRPTGRSEPLVGVTEVQLRGEADRAIPVAVRAAHADAFACNGNGACMHHSAHEVMCPSYKASRDPALSPKGRADLIREWLRRSADDSDDDAFGSGLIANLNQCLSCAACSGRCPVEVDIPELKSRVFEQFYAHRRRPMAHAVFGRFESLVSVARRFPAGANLALGPAQRLLGLVDLPTLPSYSTSRPTLPPFDPRTRGADVVLLSDVFTAALEPETLRQCHDVLVSIGYRVSVAPLVSSGKFDHVKGRRRAFARSVRSQKALIDRITATGARALAIEPATALLHHHEYPSALPGYPSEGVRGVGELIHERAERLVGGRGGTVVLLSHCTETAMAGQWVDQWESILSTAGYSVDRPAVGCCGMAGVFGHEIENQAMSKQLWELSWAEIITRAGVDEVPVFATGYSCRSQAKRMRPVVHAPGRDMAVRHPIHALRATPVCEDR